MHKATSRDLPIEQTSLGLSCTCRVVLVLFMSVIFRSPPGGKGLVEFMSLMVARGEAQEVHLGRNNLWMAYFSRSKNRIVWPKNILPGIQLNLVSYQQDLRGPGRGAHLFSCFFRLPSSSPRCSSSLLVRFMTCPKIRPNPPLIPCLCLGPGLLCIS